MLPVRGSGCVLFVPGPREVVVVVAVALLDFLLGSGSLLVHPGEGSVHPAALPYQRLEGSECGRPS